MVLKISQSVAQVKESATIALADRVRKLTSQGKRIIPLQTGDPDFATPRPIIEAAHAAMSEGLTHYGPSRGLPELRRAIAAKLKSLQHVDYDPETDVLVTHGGVHAYMCAIGAIVDHGDEVLIPDPSWMTHSNIVRLANAVPVYVPSRDVDGFWPTTDAWRSRISPRTVAMVINSPSNPTGSVAKEEYLKELVDLAHEHDLWIISDEVYHALLFDNRDHVSVASLPTARSRTITIDSFSKTYAMTGWRIGYLAAPSALVAESLKLVQHSITNVATFVQRAALEALTNACIAEEVQLMRTEYKKRRDIVLALLAENSDVISSRTPDGAFYFFLQPRVRGISSAEMSLRLVDEAGVALVAGSAFGESGEGFLRMTIAAPPDAIVAGFNALVAWLRRMGA